MTMIYQLLYIFIVCVRARLLKDYHKNTRYYGHKKNVATYQYNER